MFDLDRWQEIYASLRKNRLRTALTAFGVFWGIFLLVIMLGAGNGLANGAKKNFGGTATNSFFVWGQRTSKDFRGVPAGREVEFNNGDTAAIREQVPEAKVVAPRLQLGGYNSGNLVTRGKIARAFSVMGDYPEVAGIQSFRFPRGRFVNHLDLEEERKVAVIGTRVEELFFEKGEDPIGQSLEINGVYFKVIGVFAGRRGGDEAERNAETIFVPFTTFQKVFNQGDRVGWFAITSQDGVPASVVETKVLELLRERHRIAPDDTRAIGHFNLEEEFNRGQLLFQGIGALIWIVGIGTLAAGVIGVSNILVIIVRERTREIGLRRAIGATPFAVVSQILLEAIVLTSLAGYFGLLAGIAVLEGVRAVLTATGASGGFQDPGVSLANALQAFAILVVAGALAGLIPAQRAVAVTPVAALRSE